MDKNEATAITLRDYFAGQALQGQIASLSNAEVAKEFVAMGEKAFEWAAISAYHFADAMIAERNKTQ